MQKLVNLVFLFIIKHLKALRRKITDYLNEWKNRKDHLPLIVIGARQIGKTFSILEFAKQNYENVVYINFVDSKQYKNVFNGDYTPETIIKNISAINPNFNFVPFKTLIFFDEIQDCIDCSTSLKFFKLDGRYDVICSGSMMGINYQNIHSVSVGYKEGYEMNSLDFEEFLWAYGYSQDQINDLLLHMTNLQPFTKFEFDAYDRLFKEYMIVGGMPRIVSQFIKNKKYSGIPQLQKQLSIDYKADIQKYAEGLDRTKIINIYNSIKVFLGRNYKKFQISKIAKNKSTREYIGAIDWLNSAGLINVCYSLSTLNLPLGSNYNPKIYKVYFRDIGMLIGELDEESRYDLMANKNFNTYKGAVYENVMADVLHKQQYNLYFYISEDCHTEINFFVRDIDNLIPIEMKANDGTSKSIIKIINNKNLKDINFGIKFCNKNIGYNGTIYTFPYFCSFLLRRYLLSKSKK